MHILSAIILVATFITFATALPLSVVYRRGTAAVSAGTGSASIVQGTSSGQESTAGTLDVYGSASYGVSSGMNSG